MIYFNPQSLYYAGDIGLCNCFLSYCMLASEQLLSNDLHMCNNAFCSSVKSIEGYNFLNESNQLQKM